MTWIGHSKHRASSGYVHILCTHQPIHKAHYVRFKSHSVLQYPPPCAVQVFTKWFWHTFVLTSVEIFWHTSIFCVPRCFRQPQSSYGKGISSLPHWVCLKERKETCGTRFGANRVKICRHGFWQGATKTKKSSSWECERRCMTWSGQESSAVLADAHTVCVRSQTV